MYTSKRVLVVYYSRTGHTERVAKELATRLGADIECLRDLQHGPGVLGQLRGAFHAWRQTPAKIASVQHDPANYEITIVGTPVWVGQMSPAMRAYLRNVGDGVRNMALFVTSGDTDVSKLIPSVEALIGKTITARAGFTARELADADSYQRKVSAFVESLNRSPTSAQTVDESPVPQRCREPQPASMRSSGVAPIGAGQ